MKDGNCPKCGSTAIYHGPEGSVAIGWSMKDASMIPLTLMKGAQLTNYVCTACGYLERYIAKPEDCTAISEHWTKVESRDSKN